MNEKFINIYVELTNNYENLDEVINNLYPHLNSLNDLNLRDVFSGLGDVAKNMIDLQASYTSIYCSDKDKEALLSNLRDKKNELIEFFGDNDDELPKGKNFESLYDGMSQNYEKLSEVMNVLHPLIQSEEQRYIFSGLGDISKDMIGSQISFTSTYCSNEQDKEMLISKLQDKKQNITVFFGEEGNKSL